MKKDLLVLLLQLNGHQLALCVCFLRVPFQNVFALIF